MIGKAHRISLLMVLLTLFSGVMAEVNSSPVEVQIAMRSIGHELLKQSGNDTSQLPVVQQQGKDYIISLGDDFHFVPDSLAQTVNSIIAHAGISEHYFVQVFTCGSTDLAYGYGYNIKSRVPDMPCLGRFQPRDCYQLTITLNDQKTETEIPAESNTNDAEPELKSNQASSVASQLLLVLVLVGLVLLYSWNNKRLKKSEEEMSNHLFIGRYRFDFRHLKLEIDGSTDELTSKEADLLVLLFKHLNETIERADILKEVWGDDGNYNGRTLDVYISKLRKKLEQDPSIKIINVRGVGYKMAIAA